MSIRLSCAHRGQLLAGCLVIAFAAGCSGPASSQAASTPTARFGVFPGSGESDGSTTYKVVLGTVEGTGARTFTLQPRTGMMFWVGCIGTGTVELDSPDVRLGVGWHCDKTGSGSAWQLNPTHAAAGREVVLRLTAPPGTRWALRVDATPR